MFGVIRGGMSDGVFGVLTAAVLGARRVVGMGRVFARVLLVVACSSCAWSSSGSFVAAVPRREPATASTGAASAMASRPALRRGMIVARRDHASMIVVVMIVITRSWS